MEKILLEQVRSSDFISLVLSKKRNKSQEEKKVELKLIDNISNTYQFSCYTEKKVFHINCNEAEVIPQILLFIKDKFKQVNIFTKNQDYQILANKTDKVKITKSKPSKSPSTSNSHNRSKNYIIPNNTPCDFLIYLGVMKEDGKVIERHYSKFRQINKFLEILRDSINESTKINSKTSNKPIKIVDFGCGKAYLTFAIYYYLVKNLNMSVEIIGIDLKEDVIEFCEKTARALNYEGLSFTVGDIANFKTESCDIVVSLHACDTATDFGLINAVSWNSKIILSVSCCQHELFNQVDNQLLNPILKHGINKDKFTELLTNGLRALKLESVGYKVSMVEFTSLEHTAKNVVIRAVKTNKNEKNKMKALNEYNKLKEAYKVVPSIDKL